MPCILNFNNNAKDEKNGSKSFSGIISIVSNLIKKDRYGVIKNDLFIIYNSEKLQFVEDVLYLVGCYLKIEESKCYIYQLDFKSPRLIFESKSEIPIET